MDTNIRAALELAAGVAVREIIDLEYAALGDTCLASQLRPIVLKAMAAVSGIVVNGPEVSK
jgi:hypothetical protein